MASFTYKRRRVGEIDLLKTAIEGGITVSEKESILRKIRKEWQRLLTVSFEKEGSTDEFGNITQHWKELDDGWKERKSSDGLLPGILEAHTPTLLTRYKKGITYNSSNFSIDMPFPILQTTGRNVATAEVHQYPGFFDRPARRINKYAFENSARNIVIKELTNNE